MVKVRFVEDLAEEGCDVVGRVPVCPTAKRTQDNRIVTLQKEIRRGGGGRGGSDDRGGEREGEEDSGRRGRDAIHFR